MAKTVRVTSKTKRKARKGAKQLKRQRRLQRETAPVFVRAAFKRDVRKILEGLAPNGMNISKDVVPMLMTATQSYMVKVSTGVKHVMGPRKTVTASKKDLQAYLKIEVPSFNIVKGYKAEQVNRVIQDLVLKGGPLYISKTLYDPYRTLIWSFMHAVLEKAVTLCESRRRKTINGDDVKHALEFFDSKVYY